MAVANRIALTAQQRSMILALIKKHLPDTTIWIYGSRVKGTARSSSDLDMVAFSTRQNEQALYALREAFDDSDLPFRVDLFAWDNIPDTFKDAIIAEHAVLHEGQRHDE